MNPLRTRFRRPDLPTDDFASALFEDLADAAVACNADGTHAVFNRRAREIHQLPRGPFPIRRWGESYKCFPRGGGEPLQPDQLPLARALRGEHLRDVTVESLSKSGERQVIRVEGGPLHDADGDLQGAVVVMHDVTDSVDAESRTELESAIVANLRDAVAVVRAADGVVVYVNPAWERMFGYGRGEIVGRHISTVNAPGDQTPDEIMGALEEEGVWTGGAHNVRKDGTRFWSTARISPLEHPRYGALWVSLHTDATEQGASGNERFRAVFEEAPVGMAMVGNDMLIVDANRVFCELTGYSRAELVGKPFSDVEHPDDVALDAELAAKTFRGEIPRYRVEKRYVTKQGSVVPVVLRGTVVRGLDGRVLYGIAVVEETQA